MLYSQCVLAPPSTRVCHQATHCMHWAGTGGNVVVMSYSRSSRLVNQNPQEAGRQRRKNVIWCAELVLLNRSMSWGSNRIGITWHSGCPSVYDLVCDACHSQFMSFINFPLAEEDICPLVWLGGDWWTFFSVEITWPGISLGLAKIYIHIYKYNYIYLYSYLFLINFINIKLHNCQACLSWHESAHVSCQAFISLLPFSPCHSTVCHVTNSWTFDIHLDNSFWIYSSVFIKSHDVPKGQCTEQKFEWQRNQEILPNFLIGDWRLKTNFLKNFSLLSLQL